MTLNQIKTGNTAVIYAVGGEGALRCRLLDMGLIPKTKVKLQKVAPMGDPIEIRLRGYELTLRVEDAQKIEVREENSADAKTMDNDRKESHRHNRGGAHDHAGHKGQHHR